MNLLKRFEKGMLSLYIDCQYQLEHDKKNLHKAFGTGLAIGTALNAGIIACAADDIQGFGNTISKLIGNIYDATFGVVTIFAALMAIIALIVRMTANQQKAAQATSWLVRIVICYVAINCIGLIVNVINNTTKQYRSWDGK